MSAAKHVGPADCEEEDVGDRPLSPSLAYMEPEEREAAMRVVQQRELRVSSDESDDESGNEDEEVERGRIIMYCVRGAKSQFSYIQQYQEWMLLYILFKGSPARMARSNDGRNAMPGVQNKGIFK